MKRPLVVSAFMVVAVTTALAFPHARGQAQQKAQAPARGVAAKPASPTRPATARRQSAPMMATLDPAFLAHVRYRLVGPSRGGRVTCVTGVPSQPATFYMGVASGGVFRTTDNGATWTPVTDGGIPLGSIGSIAVADSNPDLIYVGTGSDGVRSNVSTGRGVYKTADGGKTWMFAGLRNAGQIGAVRIHPTNPDVVWVAAVGDAFKRNPERGVFKTTDGGKTWKQTLFINDGVGAMDVELQPGNPDVVYAWMSRLERKPWTIISGSRDGGFYKSTDGGATFTKIVNGLPNELIGKGNLAVTPAKPDRLYALVEAKPGGGFYRSDDAGQSWTLVNSQPSLITRPFYYTTLGADPSNPDVVYAGAESFFKSSDAGKTFTSMRTPHGDNHDIWVNPKNPNIIVQSNDGGANVSTDGGRTWSSQTNQPTAEIYGVWLDEEFPYKLYGAQQDNTTLIISSQADPYSLSDWRTGPGCETGPIMPHPKNPDIVYGSCKGQYGVMNLKVGQEKNYWIGAQSLYGNPASDLILRFQRVSPMATSPHDPNVLYYGSQYLHRTRDKGVTWEKISPDLTAKPEGTQGVSGEPITRDVTGEEFYSTLYAIAESPLEAGVIWVGSNDGPFHVTRDNGKTWADVTPKDLPAGGRVQYIEASPHRKGSAYYAVYRYLLGDYAPYLYLTNDYGKTWKRLTDGRNGIAEDTPTRVVREDPDREGLLYAGTEFGLFVSFDNGGHWQAMQANLPAVPVTDIKVHHKDLVVSTQGRSFWILDNISALHQVTPAMSPSQPHLFKPRDGYRTRVAPNVLGPTIEYYLPNAQAGPVVVEILDGNGAVVSSYNSETPVARGGRGGRGAGAQEDPDAAPAGRGRGGAVPRVTKNAGINRLVWDVRNAAGVTVPPGAYQARLKMGTTTLTEPFTVRIDPRVAADGVTQADLDEQFAHNMRMRELVTEVNELIARVRDAQAKTAVADPAKASQLGAIASKLLTEPVRYGKPGLQAQITYLAGMTATVDQKIGRDAIARYAVLKKELEAVRAEVDKVLGKG
ncbi:MAG: WD40/YVTN/BNR-like repeat-containing protein [Bacteroidales bacterium]